tara:strand:+ start:50174 stop:50416 length:243 start_codon:yes stop_codon:yes gene_type:complete
MKILLITIALILSINQAQASSEEDRIFIEPINKLERKIAKLNCGEYKKLPQRQVNDCFAYVIELIRAELTYTDYVHNRDN